MHIKYINLTTQTFLYAWIKINQHGIFMHMYVLEFPILGQLSF